jgi:MFS family permease
VVGLLVGSAALFAAFVGVERLRPSPLVDMRLMAHRPVWSATVVAFAMGFALFIAGLVVPQLAALPAASGYGLGLTYAQIGLVLLPGALAIVAGGWASGRLFERAGARTLAGCGAFAAGAGYAVLAIEHGSVAWVVAANVPLGFGIGLVFAALTNLVVSSVDDRRTSVFAAATAVSRSTGAALGAQVAAAILIAAGVVAGFPAEHGFTGAFVLGLAASGAALAATAAIPARPQGLRS